ncbi:MAG: hydroxymethylpyrimidine/phosphomethylpyrimidine kinase [Bacteroidales bacterium]
MNTRPKVLTIAGFDPSAGAGLLADIKTMEQWQTYGMSIITANTLQTEDRFQANHWMHPEQIMEQLTLLLNHYSFAAIKVGIIQSTSLLCQLIGKIRKQQPEVPIVWDPVLSASAGFAFHKQLHRSELASVLQNITLVTPNVPEAEALFGNQPVGEAACEWGCSILLKGGHTKGNLIVDRLFQGSEEISFPHPRIDSEKHGTGCVLSSSIAAALAHGNPLPEACKKAQAYISQFIASSPAKLGYHTTDKNNINGVQINS